MEYRKLISFGKNSFVVSLPKPWVIQNNLKKGDLIYVDERESHLLLSSTPGEAVEQRKAVVDVDGKEFPQIRREINAAYIENCREITLKGKQLKEKTEELLPIIRELIALEVMELDASKIVSKDFLDMDKVSVAELVKKMDIIIRSMLKDCSQSFNEPHADNLDLRDFDVNRLSFLVYRSVRYGMRNPSLILKNFSVSTVDLLNFYWTAFHLEAIANEAKRISRAMEETDLPKDKKKEFAFLLSKAVEYYQGIIKAYHQGNRESALELSNQKRPLVKTAGKFFEENRAYKRTSFLVDRYTRLLGQIHELGRLVYQY